jgi:hypothetical protein
MEKQGRRTMRGKHFVLRMVACWALAVIGGACGSDDLGKTPTGGSGGAPALKICDVNLGVEDRSNETCKPLPDDYTPRDAASANDTWPACISDSNQYVPIGPLTITAAHAQDFEDISSLLRFGGLYAPTPQEFAMAHALYSSDGGIASFVLNLEDDHYPAAPKRCQDLAPDEQASYPFRCVGPIRIKAILDIAFEAGQKAEEPALQVARIEAALLWYFYMTTYQEAIRAALVAEAIDGAWGAYSGGESREKPKGLAKYVFDRDQEAHQRIWDGLLALRCWRDLDNPQGPAMDLAMQKRAVEQLDRALLRGIAAILRQRIQVISCEPAWESSELIGGILLRESKARDAELGQVFLEEISRRRATLVDAEKLTSAIDELFPCP